MHGKCELQIHKKEQYPKKQIWKTAFILILKATPLACNNLAFQTSVIYCSICLGGHIPKFSTTVFHVWFIHSYAKMSRKL